MHAETQEIRSGIYLLHSATRYPNGKQPRHYVGSAQDIAERIYHHRTNPDVRLLQVMAELGILWDVARVWISPVFLDPKRRYAYERRLKRGGHFDRLCPHCNPQAERVAPFENVYSVEIDITF